MEEWPTGLLFFVAKTTSKKFKTAAKRRRERRKLNDQGPEGMVVCPRWERSNYDAPDWGLASEHLSLDVGEEENDRKITGNVYEDLKAYLLCPHRGRRNIGGTQPGNLVEVYSGWYGLHLLVLRQINPWLVCSSIVWCKYPAAHFLYWILSNV